MFNQEYCLISKSLNKSVRMNLKSDFRRLEQVFEKTRKYQEFKICFVSNFY